MEQNERTFADLVSEALDSLPDEIAEMVTNVEVVVEPEPPLEYLRGLPRGHTLFGLYHGVPLTKRGVYDRALIVVTGVLGLLINVGARTVERRALAWHQSVRGEVAV